MQAALAGRANVARSQPYYCDVIPPGIDKGRLVDLLAERLGVPQVEILVLGDMENDLEMFAQGRVCRRHGQRGRGGQARRACHDLVERGRRLRRGDRALRFRRLSAADNERGRPQAASSA